jgi:hypothetical protein
MRLQLIKEDDRLILSSKGKLEDLTSLIGFLKSKVFSLRTSSSSAPNERQTGKQISRTVKG